MKQMVIPREYTDLLSEKAHIEKKLRYFLVEKLPAIRHYDALQDIAKLKLKGGAKDLSLKLDYYLYA